MPRIDLPFTEDNKADKHKEGLYDCTLFQMLHKTAQEASQRCPHLLEYLHMVPVAEIGIPQYHAKLAMKMTDITSPNVIYPVMTRFLRISTRIPMTAEYLYLRRAVLTQKLDCLIAGCRREAAPP
jgi:hypothetical protein